MKKVYFFLLAICLIGVACKKDDPKDGQKSINKDQSLKNTWWKLAGIVNAETGVLTELESNEDCEWCYTLVFEQDSSAIGVIGRELLPTVSVDLSRNPIIRISALALPPPWIIDEIDDPFYNAVKLVTSYSYERNELKFFYKENEVEHYLLYGVKAKKYIPASLVNTKWKLVGWMNDETGVLTELEPKDCEECYTLTFDTDSTVIAFSIMQSLKVDVSRHPFRFYTAVYECEYYKDGEMYCDVDDFRSAIRGMRLSSFIATSDELKLFYRRGYFLFKPLK